MKKIALYLFILAPAALSAMDGYQPHLHDQPGHIPTAEELAEIHRVGESNGSPAFTVRAVATRAVLRVKNLEI